MKIRKIFGLSIGLYSIIMASAYAADPAIKTNLPKTSFNSSESFSLTYYLLNNKGRRITSPTGTVTLNSYTDASCSAGQSQVGSSINLATTKTGTYSFPSPGTFYLKPSLTGYTGNCLGPITVLGSSGAFEQITMTKTSQTSSSVSVQVRWETLAGTLSTTTNSRIGISFSPTNACSTRISGSRTFLLSQKQGVSSITFARPNAATVYACASSGAIKSSLLIPVFNRSPVAVADSGFTATAGSALSILASQLLSNDTDPDGNILTVSSVQNPSTGTVSVAGNSISFTPASSFSGTATFSYSITDGSLTSTASVSVSVSCSQGFYNKQGQCTPNPEIQGSFLDFSGKLASGPLGNTCSVTEEGKVRCWGTNQQGQLGDGTTILKNYPITVPNLENTVSVTIGSYHGCALIQSGSVKCWGHNSNGRLGVNQAGDYLTSTLVNGLGNSIIKISAGSEHTCALSSSGWVKCWGKNGNGQLGNGTQNDANSPQEVLGHSSGIVSITSGANHTCSLSNSGQVRCWGANDSKQLGRSDIGAFSLTPVTPTGLSSTSIKVFSSSSSNHTCSITKTDGVKCWGQNNFGQLGTGATSSSEVPVNSPYLTSSTKEIATGYEHTCAINNSNGAVCWGRNSSTSFGINRSGWLGDGTPYDSLTPVQVMHNNSGVYGISASTLQTCILYSRPTLEKKVFCFGYNYNGSIGEGIFIPYSKQQLIETRNVSLYTQISDKKISVGVSHACAVTASGGVMCWGKNNIGQLGDGTTTDRMSPGYVSGLSSGVISVSAGNYFTCALKSDETVYCWGHNHYGQLGSADYPFGPSFWSSVPVQVQGIQNVKSIAAGGEHACAVFEVFPEKRVACWGRNNSGQLGNNLGQNPITYNTTMSPVPVLVINNSGYTPYEVTAGGYHSCFLSTLGYPFCWGNNSNGRLGNNSTTQSNIPVFINRTVSSISAGVNHTCSVSSGKIYCWGYNGYGQIGDGTLANKLAPTLVSEPPSDAMNQTIAVSAGSLGTCATVSGRLFCWGAPLGNGTLNSSNIPVGGGIEYQFVDISNSKGSTVCALNVSGSIFCWGGNYFGSGQDLLTPTQISNSGQFYRTQIITYDIKPSGMGLFGSCSGDSVEHSPEPASLTKRSIQCESGSFFTKFDSTYLFDLFSGIQSPNRILNVFDYFSTGSSPHSNSSIPWDY